MGELMKVEHGFAFKGEYFSESGELVVLTPGNFHETGGFRLRPDKDHFYQGKFPDRYLLRKNDLIVAMTEQGEGLLGSSALIPESGKYLHNQRIGLVRPRKNKTDTTFLYYLFNTDYVRQQIRNSSAGAKIRHTSPERIYRTKVRIPSQNCQTKIAAILSAYDELIENNKRRIALLEKLAEEIYREWFVRLRFPSHEAVRTVKGVPADWSVKRFHEIVECYIGGGWGEDNESTTFSDGAFVIRGTDIPHVQIGAFDECPFRYHKTSNLKSRKLKAADFVFEVSGGSKDQLLGRNVLVTESILKHLKAPVIPASFCKLIRFRQDLASPYFMKYFLKLYYDYDLVGIFQVQSTGISNYQFESFLKFQTVILPSEKLRDAFEEKIKPILELKDSISLLNIRLRKTRDLLVPRLISGKLPVENLDIQFPPGMLEKLSQTSDLTHHA
jgi:type I restriction enzyme S subunit